jgi:hypothetical protein
MFVKSHSHLKWFAEDSNESSGPCCRFVVMDIGPIPCLQPPGLPVAIFGIA